MMFYFNCKKWRTISTAGKKYTFFGLEYKGKNRGVEKKERENS